MIGKMLFLHITLWFFGLAILFAFCDLVKIKGRKPDKKKRGRK